MCENVHRNSLARTTTTQSTTTTTTTIRNAPPREQQQQQQQQQQSVMQSLPGCRLLVILHREPRKHPKFHRNAHPWRRIIARPTKKKTALDYRVSTRVSILLTHVENYTRHTNHSLLCKISYYIYIRI